MPKSRQVNAGSVVNMECRAPRGTPDPIVFWEKNGAPLKSGKGLNVIAHPNGTLVISNASVSDNGEYVCVARNDAGFRRSASAYLNVFGKKRVLSVSLFLSSF